MKAGNFSTNAERDEIMTFPGVYRNYPCKYCFAVVIKIYSPLFSNDGDIYFDHV